MTTSGFFATNACDGWPQPSGFGLAVTRKVKPIATKEVKSELPWLAPAIDASVRQSRAQAATAHPTRDLAMIAAQTGAPLRVTPRERSGNSVSYFLIGTEGAPVVKTCSALSFWPSALANESVRTPGTHQQCRLVPAPPGKQWRTCARAQGLAPG